MTDEARAREEIEEAEFPREAIDILELRARLAGCESRHDALAAVLKERDEQIEGLKRSLEQHHIVIEEYAALEARPALAAYDAGRKP